MTLRMEQPVAQPSVPSGTCLHDDGCEGYALVPDHQVLPDGLGAILQNQHRLVARPVWISHVAIRNNQGPAHTSTEASAPLPTGDNHWRGGSVAPRRPDSINPHRDSGRRIRQPSVVVAALNSSGRISHTSRIC